MYNGIRISHGKRKVHTLNSLFSQSLLVLVLLFNITVFTDNQKRLNSKFIIQVVISSKKHNPKQKQHLMK